MKCQCLQPKKTNTMNTAHLSSLPDILSRPKLASRHVEHLLAGRCRHVLQIPSQPAAQLCLDLQCDLLSLDASYHLLRCILGNDLIVVQHLKLLCSVPAHEVHDGLGTTRVLF
jgi:hypothetical protein